MPPRAFMRLVCRQRVSHVQHLCVPALLVHQLVGCSWSLWHVTLSILPLCCGNHSCSDCVIPVGIRAGSASHLERHIYAFCRNHLPWQYTSCWRHSHMRYSRLPLRQHLNRNARMQVPTGDNYFAALNSAVFSDGSFVYVPKGVHSPMELSTYFRINAMNTGQFERTLIIAEEGAYVSYLEGCTAPAYDENQLHAAIVELSAAKDAEIKYSTVQNWYAGSAEGKGGIYNFVTKRGMCHGANSKISWTQVRAVPLWRCTRSSPMTATQRLHCWESHSELWCGIVVLGFTGTCACCRAAALYATMGTQAAQSEYHHAGTYASSLHLLLPHASHVRALELCSVLHWCPLAQVEMGSAST